MIFGSGFVLALAILVMVTGIVIKNVLGLVLNKGEGGRAATGRLAKMEERISSMEEATSGLIAEFAAVRERERFMTQLVETRARKDALSSSEAAAGVAAGQIARAPDTTSPFVVQTVSAARRVVKPGS
jgi:hypothetical protein